MLFLQTCGWLALTGATWKLWSFEDTLVLILEIVLKSDSFRTYVFNLPSDPPAYNALTSRMRSDPRMIAKPIFYAYCLPNQKIWGFIIPGRQNCWWSWVNLTSFLRQVTPFINPSEFANCSPQIHQCIWHYIASDGLLTNAWAYRQPQLSGVYPTPDAHSSMPPSCSQAAEWQTTQSNPIPRGRNAVVHPNNQKVQQISSHVAKLAN